MHIRHGQLRWEQVVAPAERMARFGVPVTHAVPSYQLVTPGGDTSLVGNFEYRVPIFGPVTLAGFFDVGLNRLLNTSQLDINPDRIKQLNAEFPEASFPGRAVVAPGTQPPGSVARKLKFVRYRM